MNNPLIADYMNGNVNVQLFNDGTMIRTIPDDEPMRVEFPSSCDVKITQFCSAGCSYCHEGSTIQGVHGDLERLKEVLSKIPAGTELALGGGSTTDHPDLIPFLQWAKDIGTICNITINQKHIKPHQDLILKLIKEDLIKGIGISYTSPAYLPDIIPIIQATDNLIFHVILGINKVADIDALQQFCIEHNKLAKILILGYKQFGFGINYYLKNTKIEANKYQWCIKLASYFNREKLVLSFDNLAIEQLKLRRFFTQEGWDTFFLGEDFIFSCYIDAIKQEFGPSSTSPAEKRRSFNDMSLLEFFKDGK